MNGFPSSGRLALHMETLLSTAAPLATFLEASRWGVGTSALSSARTALRRSTSAGTSK